MISLRNISGSILRFNIKNNSYVIPINELFDITYSNFIEQIVQNLLNSVPPKLSVQTWDPNNTYQPVIRSEGLEASHVSYDNEESELPDTYVQDAIDTLAKGLPASTVSFNPSETELESTNVQDAIEELTQAESIEFTNTETELESTNVQDALSELDADMLENSYVYKPICASTALIKGMEKEFLYDIFWNYVRKTVGNVYIEDCVRFFWIKIITTAGAIIPFTRYSNTTSLVNAIYTVIDLIDNKANENVNLCFMIKESTKIPFSTVKVCRNSLFSGMMGRHKGKRNRTGVSTKFTNNIYYNQGELFGGALATKFLQHFYSITPPTNDDNIVWNTTRRSNAYSLPKEGTEIHLQGGYRLAYNTSGSSYESVTNEHFVFGHPSFLYAPEFGKMLLLETFQGKRDYMHFINDSVVAVFPLTAGTYRSFAIYPCGFDVFVTDYIDTSIYYPLCIMFFKSERRCRYIPLTKLSDDGLSRSMWRLPRMFRSERLATCSIDGSMVPSTYEFALQHIESGIISKQQVATVKRRLPNAPLLICPSFNTR